MTKKKTWLAFGKIESSTRYPTRFAHFPYLSKALINERRRLSRGLSTLEAGCGHGLLAAFYDVQEGSKLFGLDLWTYQLQQAAARGVYDGLIQANLLEGLPFRDHFVDVVIAGEVLMYLPNASQVLSEFHRILRPGGKLFVYNPICFFPSVFAALKTWGRKIHQEKQSIVMSSQADWRNAKRPCRTTYYSYRALIRDITSAHFEVTDAIGFRLFRNRISWMKFLENYLWYFSLITFIAGRHPYLASDLMVAARRK